MKEQKIDISQLSLLACPGYTCHKLSVIIKCPLDAFTFIDRSCFKIQLTVQ